MKPGMIRRLIAAASLVALAVPATVGAEEKPEIGAWGVDLAGVSTTVTPGDDFWTYVNEGWLARTTIPAGMPSYEDATRIYLANEQRIQGIINGLLGSAHASGTPEQQIVDYYRSASDQARRDALGLKPLAADFALIRAARTHGDIARISARVGMPGVFSAGVMTDAGAPRSYIPVVGQGGLTLPTSDYYTKQGEPYDSLRMALRAYVAATLQRAGSTDADGKADRIIALETEIARRQWTGLQLRDVVKRYHPMPAVALPAYAPGFPWKLFLAQWGGLERAPKLSVIGDSAVQGLARLFAETPVSTWQDWMTFRLIDASSGDLGSVWE